VKLGLATEAQELNGRRRRTFSITSAGDAAVQEWLRRPSHDSAELRDPGLLQLYFADLGSAETPRIITREQLAIHRAKLKEYEERARVQRSTRGAAGAVGRLEEWHGHSLRMGTLYERAAVAFWQEMAAETADDVAAPGDRRDEPLIA
jgi:DNA-binding PadR family transcriptional regulator